MAWEFKSLRPHQIKYCKREWLSGRASPCQGERREFESRLPLQLMPSFLRGHNIWRHSQVVRHGPAKPRSPVQIWVAPPNSGAKLYRHPKKPVTTGFFVAFHPFADLGSTVYLLPQTSINHKNIIKAPVKENLGRRFCHFPVQSINLHIFSYNRSKYFRKRMASENP